MSDDLSNSPTPRAVTPLTAKEEAEGRGWHIDDEGHRARKPECLVCHLFATLDAARSSPTPSHPLPSEPDLAALRSRIEALPQHDPYDSGGGYLDRQDVLAALAANSEPAPKDVGWPREGRNASEAYNAGAEYKPPTAPALDVERLADEVRHLIRATDEQDWTQRDAHMRHLRELLSPAPTTEDEPR